MAQAHPPAASPQDAIQALQILQNKLKDEISRAEQAERACEVLNKQLAALKSRVADRDTEEDDMAAIRAENGELRSKLEDARSHIFSLQPYIKELTAEEVGNVSAVLGLHSMDIFANSIRTTT